MDSQRGQAMNAGASRTIPANMSTFSSAIFTDIAPPCHIKTVIYNYSQANVRHRYFASNANTICSTAEIYIITESRLSVCLLSPLKRRDVQWRNFARGRAPCVCNIWAGSYVDRCHHWEENENFIKLRLHFCCSGSKAAATCCYI